MERTTVLDIEGMHCGHCAKAVTNEVAKLDGVLDVAIELNREGTSHATVVSEGPLSAEDLRAAVDEAGYDLVGVR